MFWGLYLMIVPLGGMLLYGCRPTPSGLLALRVYHKAGSSFQLGSIRHKHIAAVRCRKQLRIVGASDLVNVEE